MFDQPDQTSMYYKRLQPVTRFAPPPTAGWGVMNDAPVQAARRNLGQCRGRSPPALYRRIGAKFGARKLQYSFLTTKVA
ncbi:unnamed protein product [Arctia plantaginis]|uniref:Uncharacterized protein n=1 Tax=Arctia plantaginis TaxID=874455 RepID=A0A8S0YQL9_ARCPL|nr:unnamed protein product [Arctia plantaginis]